MTTRLLYIDDSGHNDTGWAVFGYVQVDIIHWSAAFRPWLEFRKHLYATARIPSTYEFHATDFLGSRTRPSRDAAWNADYPLRWKVVTDALDVLAQAPGLTVGAVYRQTTARGRAFHGETVDLYQRLVTRFDAELTAAGDHGIVIMDGDGTAGTYTTAHRELKLNTRSLVEDPWFQPSHSNQWVQMADLVSYTAYQSLLRSEPKKFAWDWYADHLALTDPRRGPQPL